MLEQITVCEQRDGKLYAIEEKEMMTYLNEETMEVYVVYKMQRLVVQGSIYAQYVVIN